MASWATREYLLILQGYIYELNYVSKILCDANLSVEMVEWKTVEDPLKNRNGIVIAKNYGKKQILMM